MSKKKSDLLKKKWNSLDIMVNCLKMRSVYFDKKKKVETKSYLLKITIGTKTVQNTCKTLIIST